jgi:hypothetical protein
VIAPVASIKLGCDVSGLRTRLTFPSFPSFRTVLREGNYLVALYFPAFPTFPSQECSLEVPSAVRPWVQFDRVRKAPDGLGPAPALQQELGVLAVRNVPVGEQRDCRGIIRGSQVVLLFPLAGAPLARLMYGGMTAGFHGLRRAIEAGREGRGFRRRPSSGLDGTSYPSSSV